jgi:16S rRNA (guanine966-N2)-methyltransferase
VRVIAGSAKGRPLRPPRTSATRPITDRAKESLFAILAPRLPDARFLDLFAGTGGVGIEALSRGCAHATFVERSRDALAGIRHNLDVTGLADRAEVAGRDVFAFLAGPPASYEVIFVAPPQWLGLWTRTVALLDREPGWLTAGALVVAQHDPAESTRLDLTHLAASDERTYGRVRFTFFQPR